MGGAGRPPRDARTYGPVIMAAARERRVGEALRLTEEAEAAGLRLDEHAGFGRARCMCACGPVGGRCRVRKEGMRCGLRCGPGRARRPERTARAVCGG